MPTITIDGKICEFQKGQNILQVALENDIAIPYYCWHPALSVVASCRICLAEVWAPNPKKDNKLEPIPKLVPTCQTAAGDGQVVYSNSPKAIANQRSVMEYLLINHPVDCPVCDQAGECYLQDYAYQYGRSAPRFQETKVKQPKKDLGPHVLLYADRCIMCSRCVRFCREVTGTGELIVQGRGVQEEIDVFPGMALDNRLSANVIDLCPVGALLDKDFLFQQRVWFLKRTPSIDGITASGDNIWIDHNNGTVYRVKPRTNLDVNGYWITDEVRYGWKFVHDPNRLSLPAVRGEEAFEPSEAAIAYETAYARINERLDAAESIALMVSPMLSCEDAYLLARYVLSIDPEAVIGVGPVPREGEDKRLPGGFTIHAEKVPNVRGVKRVLSKLTARVLDAGEFAAALRSQSQIGAVILTGNYPSAWVTTELREALESGAKQDRFVVLIDTLPTSITARADVGLPGATWMEKSGTFENAAGRLQAFERAIEPIDFCKGEAQIALDLMAMREGAAPEVFNPANVRREIAETHKLSEFLTDVHRPAGEATVESDMVMVEL
jgi:NADH-quinone oxidoreductase subunit G